MKGGNEMLQRMRKMQSQDGLTLIELLIVIVILGILAAIVVFAVGGITDKGKAAACKADRGTIEVASEAYYAQNGSYAATMDALVAAKLLRETPSSTAYTVNYSAA